jgi:hypothetical protein
MSSAGVQLARSEAALNGRTPLAHLLHALNQPLTGLQCSLELALVELRSPEEYARTVREALHLTGRMRVLVEALREIADSEAVSDREQSQHFSERFASDECGRVAAGGRGAGNSSENEHCRRTRGSQHLIAAVGGFLPPTGFSPEPVSAEERSAGSRCGGAGERGNPGGMELRPAS